MKVILPAFIYPSDQPQTQQAKDWARIMAVAGKLGGIIVNPNSGPGPVDRDANYVQAIAALRTAGTPTFGYVPTDYAKRTDAEINIAFWQSLWGIFHIFLDEASSDPKDLDYYAKLNVRTAGRVITNQGTSPQTSRYLKCADVICNFESTFAKYMEKRFSDWEIANKYRMFHIVLGCPASQLSAAINRARMYAGYVFITHETDDEPEKRAYKVLPSYWEQLVTRVSSGIVSNLLSRFLP